MPKKTEKSITTGKGEIVLYQSPDGKAALDVRLEGETLWLNLNQLAGLFERDKSVISRHLGNVFKSGELERNSVVAFFATTAADGKTYNVEYFNLDTIISVGYRVTPIGAPSFASGLQMYCESIWFRKRNYERIPIL